MGNGNFAVGRSRFADEFRTGRWQSSRLDNEFVPIAEDVGQIEELIGGGASGVVAAGAVDQEIRHAPFLLNGGSNGYKFGIVELLGTLCQPGFKRGFYVICNQRRQ